ncbi:MAG: alkyl hydroperoxide reductase subunit F [Silvanigrellales bacterium]|nr:alkyl hydroperoxide reductase subunit F [Silvanigrellales bacterium]
MLTNDIKQQLSEHFSKLETDVELHVANSSHPQQGELLDMLEGIASSSPRVTLSKSRDSLAIPRFEVRVAGSSTGVAFVGVPGGHEFTSLILAILNAGGVGRVPDAGTQARMSVLAPVAGGKAEVRTYVSLSCENCPDVVQVLNQVALFGKSISHTMVEGSVVPEELERLKIQGVPAVFIGDKLVHSGRGSLSEILSKLETALGTTGEAATFSANLGHYDVAVLGGGPAGVSAAIYSARKGLKVAVVAEKIGGQVNDTKGIENFISVLYTEGPQLSAGLASHLRSYPVDVIEHRRLKTVENDSATRTKNIRLESGESLTTKQVIVATGAKWRTLGVPGEEDYLGRGVAYCPHCDGPFFKGRPVAVVGGGNSGVEAAIDLAGICSEITLLEFADTLKADQVLVDKLKSLPNVRILTSARTVKVVGDGGKVTGLDVEDRVSGKTSHLPFDGVFVQIGLVPNSECVKGLVTLNRYGEIEVDSRGRTNVHGIYGAGDVTTTPHKQIIIAMGEGAKVALSAFEDTMRGE